MSQEHHLAAERYQLLLAQMKEEFEEEFGRERGWQTKAAKVIGVTRGYVGQIWRGERSGGGAKSVKHAVDRVGISSDFFYREMSGVPHYTKFLERGTKEVDEYPALVAFLASDVGKTADEEELALLRAHTPKRGQAPVFESYFFLLQAYRAGVPLSAAERAAERSEAALHAAVAKGAKPVKRLRAPKAKGPKKKRPKRT